jgi:cyclopropane fatty-acyl-phospholipid synthase-like methyltransferase
MKVLEIGCGCLHLGIPLIRYLEKGNYVGIDPNEWLRQKAMKRGKVRELLEEKKAEFLSTDDFDASVLGLKFDLVFSHSVLSHFAHWQFEQFLQNVGKVLALDGCILSSIRLAEGNAYGSTGTPNGEDSMAEEWQYPGVSFFKLPTVKKVADEHGFTVTHIPEFTEFYTMVRPNEFHDWVLFHRKKNKKRLISWKGEQRQDPETDSGETRSMLTPKS